MSFLFNKHSHFNLANLFTMVNIIAGVLAIYFIFQQNFIVAIVLAWTGGAFDIFDGKISRKFNLSTEFGVQIDSFADFISFVLVPSFLIFEFIFANSSIPLPLAGVVMIYYVLAGLRRLIEFNIKTDAGSVEKYFEGVPTPLGAILLFLLYLSWSYGILANGYIALIVVAVIGALLNSKVKVPHP